MTKRTIDIGKKMVSEVFSDWYSVPSYQRHYVWTEDNVNALLDDVKDNYIEREDDEYFLGSYIIQKRKDRDTNDLLDGQQRITTLFLLFAFLRDCDQTPDDVKDGLQEFVYQKANIVRKIEERVRLSYEIRGTVKQFIQKYIVKKNSIKDNWAVFVRGANDNKENESVQHICRTLLCFKNYFEGNSDIDIMKYVQFVSQNVVMIHISADTLEDAFRLFSIMNDRGLKLSNADILKSSNLEYLKSSSEMDDYATNHREFDSARSQRLHWIKYHVEEKKKDGMLIFSASSNKGIRTYIYDKVEKYVIVLEPLRKRCGYYLLTAYHLDGKDAARDKIERMYRRKLPTLV